MKNNLISIFNMMLRGITLASKMLLIIYMGRYLDFKDIGIYGLIASTIVMTNISVGFNFNFFSKREIVSHNLLGTGLIIRDQNVFYFVQYLLLITIMLLIRQWDFFSIPYFWYFVFIIILEHFTYSINEDMLGMGKITLANLFFFIKSGLWVFPVIALGIFSPSFRNLDTILIAWILSLFLYLFFILYAVRKWPWKEISSTKIDFKRIKKGIKSSLLMWLGSFGLIGSSYIDRYIILDYLGIEIVGVYTIFFMFSNAVELLITTGVIYYSIPKMIKHCTEKNSQKFWNEFFSALKNVIVFTAVIITILIIFFPIIPLLLNKPFLENYKNVFIMMLIAVFLKTTFVMTNQYFYAQKTDKTLSLLRIFILLISLICNLILIAKYDLIGATYSMIITSLIGLIMTFILIKIGVSKKIGILYE